MSGPVTERWSGPAIDYGQSLRAKREFDVSGVATAQDAKNLLIAFDPSTAYNAEHPLSSWMYVDNIDPQPTGPTYWHVTVTYSSTPAGRHIDPTNPLLEPYRYRFEWSNITEGCDRDAFGNVIQNTAGQSFAGAAPTEVLNGFLVVERNEPFYDAVSAVAFSNAVNNADVRFGPAGQWLLRKGQACARRIVPMSVITPAARFAMVQYVIELRGGFKLDSDGYYDGFKIRIEDDGVRGWYSKGGTATAGPIVEVIDGQAQNVGFPVRLNGQGKPILAATDLSGAGGPYYIGTGASPGYALAINSPNTPPSSTVIENAGDAFFVKTFPQTMKLKDLSVLGL